MACQDKNCLYCTMLEQIREEVAMGMAPELIPELLLNVLMELGEEYGAFSILSNIENDDDFEGVVH